MSQTDDKSQKTEKPTDHRLKELRKKGQVPKSKDVVSTISTIAVFAYIWMSWDYNWQLLEELFINATQTTAQPFSVSLSNMLDHGLSAMLWIGLPAAIIGALAVVLANVMQFGFLVAPESITPQFQKINPVSGAKRIFAFKNLMETIKAIIKICLLILCIVIVMRVYIPDMLKVVYCNLQCAIDLSHQIIMIIVMLALFIFILLAIFDRWFQKQQFIKDNMMTKKELKDDRKETDGNPMIKSKRRSLARDMLHNDPTEKAVQATMLLRAANFDYLIGMYYMRGKTPLPLITLKEKGEVNRRLVQMAKQKQVPVYIEETAMKKLWELGKVNQYIPSELIQDIAPIMAAALKARGVSF